MCSNSFVIELTELSYKRGHFTLYTMKDLLA